MRPGIKAYLSIDFNGNIKKCIKSDLKVKIKANRGDIKVNLKIIEMGTLRANIKEKINNRFSILVVNFDMSSNLLIMPKNRIDGEIISGLVTSPNMHGKYGHV